MQGPITYILASLLCMCIFDSVTRFKESARWYILHSVTNAVVTYLTFPSIVAILYDPRLAFSGPSMALPVSISIALHLYHVLFFHRQMMMNDWVHHLGSAFICGGISLSHHWGHGLGWVLFFITGFPGGIDYIMLSLVKYEYMESITEKRYNCFLNRWIRMPGLFISVIAGSLGIKLGYFNGWVAVGAAIVNLSNFLNGIYYSHRVAENYGYRMGQLHKHKCIKNTKEEE